MFTVERYFNLGYAVYDYKGWIVGIYGTFGQASWVCDQLERMHG